MGGARDTALCLRQAAISSSQSDNPLLFNLVTYVPCTHARMHTQLTNTNIHICLHLVGVRIVEWTTLLTLPSCCVVSAVDTDTSTDTTRSLVHSRIEDTLG